MFQCHIAKAGAKVQKIIELRIIFCYYFLFAMSKLQKVLCVWCVYVVCVLYVT